MIIFKPFKALRPNTKKANEVGALPYDVYSSSEAKKEVTNKPYSFLRIDRGEINFDAPIDMYSPLVYQQAKSLLSEWIDEGILIQEESEAFYLYELSSNNHVQTGIVGLTAVSDLIQGAIKDHEKTRADKLLDRTNHINTINAHTGPILMFYKENKGFDRVIDIVKRSLDPLFDFTSDDAITHRVFRIDNQEHNQFLSDYFKSIESLYIADGHHRAGAAKAVALARNRDVSDTTIDSNLFLSVVFPYTQLNILDYNRVIKDLHGLTTTQFLAAINEDFEILSQSNEGIHPKNKGEFSMYVDNTWYLLSFKHRNKLLDSPIDVLDVSILQDYILKPILGIDDPMNNTRIDFVGGIHGLSGLKKRVEQDCKVAFACVPTSMDELITISDQHKLMPPKSTWFEPKLLSGLLIHPIEK